MDKNPNYYDFLTIYKQDFVEKPIKLVLPIKPHREFVDPVSEGFKHYLVLNKTNIAPPDEDSDLFADKFKEKYKCVENKYFKKPIDKSTIFKVKVTQEDTTEYQAHYCDVAKDIEFYKERRRKKFFLPDGAKLPETSYSSFYRDFTTSSVHQGRPPLIVPQPTLKPNSPDLIYKMPVSDYSDHIGKLGGIIVRNGIRKPSLSL